MPTDEHNPTSQPWPPSRSADITGSGGESDTAAPADPVSPAPENEAGNTFATENPVTTMQENSGAGPTSDPDAAIAGNPENSAPDSGGPTLQWPLGPGDPTAGPWDGHNGFAPPTQDGQAPPENGMPYGTAPLDQFAHSSGQFPTPGPESLPAPGSDQAPQPDPNQFQPPGAGYGSGQFPQPNQFQAPAPGPGQFDQQPGNFQAPGPAGGGQYQDPNLYPGQQPPYTYPGGPGGPAPEGDGRFDQAPGGYATARTPDLGAPPAPETDASGNPTYGWAPPPVPTAPPAPQQSFQQPPPPGNPPAGQYLSNEWGAPGQQPAPHQPPPGQQLQPLQGQPPQGQPPQGQQRQGQFPPQGMPEPGQLGGSVNDLNLLKRARKAPRGGWRRAVHKVSRGVINPGESATDVVHRDLVSRVNAPVHGDFRIAILSLKGGVGKTTTSVGLGSTFAALRGDRVIAIDANPDLGTLAHRVPRQTRSTVRNLLEDQNITRYSDVRAHTSQSPSRLEVLASEQDPAVSEAFSEADYRRAIGILQSFYNIILTDCGTGLMHSAMSGVLDMASSLVLVTSPAIDGARSASATLDWLDYHGYAHLVRQTVVVVNASRRGSTSVNLDHLRRLFLDRTRAVQVVPFDDHLAEGAEIDLELVSKPTRHALLELAAMVADDFVNVDGYPYSGGNRY